MVTYVTPLFEYSQTLLKFVLFGIELNKSILNEAISYCSLSSNEIGGEYFVVKSDFIPDIIYV